MAADDIQFDDIQFEEMYTAADLMEAASILNGHNGAEPEHDATPVFLDAQDFADQQVEVPLPLWGNPDIMAIPAGGLCILAGRPGCGKTTWIVDLACHLATGRAYPPIDPDNTKAPTPLDVPRPLRIALIENEGPQEMFRAKIKDKLELFDGTIGSSADDGGCIVVQTWRWGAFSFSDQDAHAKARAELDEQRIDLVIGDPLSTLGPAGVGSPDDTRKFVASLRPLGLGTTRAFLFLHHFRERVERTEDELARISGAWGGHLDTLITLASGRSGDQARLAWPKLRWAKKQQPNPIILGRIWNTASYEAIAEEGDLSILEPVIYEHLAMLKATGAGRKGRGWATGTEIAKALEARRVDVTKALQNGSHLFCSLTGPAVKALGARSNAVLWGLNEWTQADTEPPEPQSIQGDLEWP